MEWVGNSALPAQELESLLATKAGETASGVKMDNGLKMVRAAYGKKGYIGAKMAITPGLSDADRRASCRISIEEGPQYRMGTVSLDGLSEGDRARLAKKWKLAQGDIYDSYYIEEFLKKAVEGSVALANKVVAYRVKPDRQSLTVDLTISFR